MAMASLSCHGLRHPRRTDLAGMVPHLAPPVDRFPLPAGDCRAAALSDEQLYGLSQQLRLLARRECVCAADGRLLSGGIDRRIEALRTQLLLILESLQDGRPPLPDADRILVRCERLIAEQRALIRALRRHAG